MNQELEQLIIENANLIYKIANVYRNSGIDMDDLKQQGRLGFIQAYYNYDPSYNIKFTTYAHPYIRGEISKYVRENRGIKISRNLTKLYYKIDKIILLLSQKYMREPTICEIANALGLEEEIIMDAMLSRNSISSIDEPIVGNEKDLSLHEIIAAPSEDIDKKILLHDALSQLTDEEYQLIENRYMNDYTQSEIATMVGMSQVQVSRKEQKVKQKIRTYMSC